MCARRMNRQVSVTAKKKVYRYVSRRGLPNGPVEYPSFPEKIAVVIYKT